MVEECLHGKNLGDLMSLTLTAVDRESYGSETKIVGALSFDSSYPTGGEVFNLASIGLVSMSTVLIEPGYGGCVFNYDYSANKVRAYHVSGGVLVEVANTTDLSAITGVRFTAYGK